MMIMKLQIKLLPKLVGQTEYVLHQSGMVILCGIHVTRPWRTYELWGSDDEPSFRKMARGHEIWDGIHDENKVWTLVDLPDDRQAIENKWIFKRKTDADSSVTLYKALIVAKCFRQVQGVDYDEIFSLVSMLKSLSESC